MKKAELTRNAIITQALHMASYDGLETLSIGPLAERMKMSKSGVFAHFGSLMNLQLDVLKKYRAEFEYTVLLPAMRAPAGLLALTALFLNSVQHVVSEKAAGCFYFSCAGEYDDRPGAMRDELTNSVLAWRTAMENCARQAIMLKQLRDETEAEQLVFEIYALLLALQHDTRLLDRPSVARRAKHAFDAILERYSRNTGKQRAVSNSS